MKKRIKYTFLVLVLLLSSCGTASILMISSTNIGFSKKGIKLILSLQPYTQYNLNINHRDSCGLVELLRRSKQYSLNGIEDYDPLNNYRVFEFNKDEIWFVSNSKEIYESIAGKFYLLEILTLKYKSDTEIEFSIKYLKSLERRLTKIGVAEYKDIGDNNIRASITQLENSISEIKENCKK